MKYEAQVYIIYRKRKLLKPYTISKVIGETHAKQVLKDNLKRLHPNRRYELKFLNEIT